MCMCNDIFQQKNMYHDQILADRRSYRQFRPVFPDEGEIKRILHAGLLAPYAAAAVGDRRIISGVSL
jgi:nitroreductase